MNDDKIFKICIITTIIGLAAIVLLSPYVNPEKLTIDKIDNSKIDNQVEVNAVIEDIHTTKSGTRIITLHDDTSRINLVIFASTVNVVDLHHGEKVNIKAKVTEYNGQTELILEEGSNLKVTG
ncbi:MAG: exodeoxyribonuclease VII large subunit [Methanosphaera sp.]|nr:exodeoxyribonuclease VII large subunit [Methanosphaera sp.]